MKDWLYTHVDNPYPSQADKDAMVDATGLTIKQINNWFINARRRYLTTNKASKTNVSYKRKHDSNDEIDEGDEEEDDEEDEFDDRVLDDDDEEQPENEIAEEDERGSWQ
jgi:DNA-directed RNA polymerase delta subunit